MKKYLIFILLAVIGLVNNAGAQTPNKAKDGVEVLYFHGKQRCKTCIAVGQYSKDVVNTDLAQMVKAGKLRFREIDFSTPEGEKIADQYKVSFSGLMLSQHKKGEEKTEDLTRFAFENAQTDTPKFKKELKIKIKDLLK